MAGHARIVVYTWIRTPGAVVPEPARRQAPRTGPPLRGRDQTASRRVGPGLVGWRVIGANNRELGRAAGPAWKVDEAYQAVHEAQLAFDRTTTHLGADAVGTWSWHISLGSEVVAVSSRGYRRQRECVYSADQFREQFPSAKVFASQVLEPRPTRHGLLILPPITVPARPITVSARPITIRARPNPDIDRPIPEVTP
jgi:hypothetical protein